MRVALRTSAADQDLRDIAIQIGVNSGRPQTAERIIDDLVDTCEQLAQLSTTAQLGTAAPELGPEIRLFSSRRWVVIFRYIDDGILVLRIVDGSQDYMSWVL